MKTVVYEDKHKMLRRVLLRDEDPDSMAEYGVPDGPPEVEMVDWEGMKREINNILVSSEVRTRTDLQRTRALENCASIFKRYLDQVFREKATEDKAKRIS